MCELVWVDERLYERGAARARQAKERRLSLTDCISFEAMITRGCREAIADDAHFVQAGFVLCGSRESA
jgi:predicted nucleic acid-binding protein